MEMLNQKQKIMAVIIIAVIVVVIGYYYINSTKEIYEYNETANVVEEIEENVKIEEDEEIIVHIAGAVVTSGIVTVPTSSRINDVIEAAGGITDDADLTNVNLAYMVEDGQKIYIPSIDDKETECQAIITEDSGIAIIDEDYQEENKLININTASLIELMALPGIGEATAAKVIEYRQTNGEFETIENIKEVSGIGDAKFNTIKEFITV